jgi:hypothetical protein
MKKFLVGSVVVAALTVSANAADIGLKKPVYKAAPPRPAPAWVWEAGGRYWYSSAKNAFNYFNDSTPTILVSRLDYNDLQAHSGEAFFRVDSPVGVFVKGYIGGGKIVGGNLFDEDFPPVVVPYSKTISDAKGHLDYANIDLGYTFFDGRGAASGPAVRLGAFVGYHYWHEKAGAFGCSQISGGDICVGANVLPTSTLVISEEDKWKAFRVGGVVDFWFTRDLKLTAEAAYARVWQSALDIHFFTFGPDPASGNGHGVHAEAVLSYQVTNLFNVGIGARWWHYETDSIDRFNQLLIYKTDRYGAFVQGSLKFGDPVVIARN